MSKLKNIFLPVLFLSAASSLSNAQVAGRSFLDGVFFAPRGTTVVLQKDGAEELSLTAPASGSLGKKRQIL